MPSMVFEIDVEMDDGTRWQVVADQRDLARWEVQPFGWPVVRIEENASMQFFRFLGWSAGLRQGHTTLTWDQFSKHCVEAMPPDDDGDEEGQGDVPADAQDPGRPARSATRSSASRGRRASR